MPDNLLCQNPSCIFIGLSLNFADILVLVLYVLKFHIKSKKGSGMMSVLTSHFHISRFPFTVRWLPSLYPRNISMTIILINFPSSYTEHRISDKTKRKILLKLRIETRSHLFTFEIARCNRKIYINIFFSRHLHLWNSFPVVCFSATYDLQTCRHNVNSHLLTWSTLFI